MAMEEREALWEARSCLGLRLELELGLGQTFEALRPFLASFEAD